MYLIKDFKTSKKIHKAKEVCPEMENCSQKALFQKELLSLFMKFISVIAIFILLLTFVFGFLLNKDPYMFPTVKDGDLVVFHRYSKGGYLPQDIIVLGLHGQKQVRRVVATAGDIVDITEDGLIINGALQYEPDIHSHTARYHNGATFPLTIQEGQVLVLADSREDAPDSRVYGCVNIKDTLGKVMTIIRWRSI